MIQLQQHDHDMIHLAMARGPVMVERGKRRALATLISWRPHRNGRRTSVARVQFSSGRYASVRIEQVYTIEGKGPDGQSIETQEGSGAPGQDEPQAARPHQTVGALAQGRGETG